MDNIKFNLKNGVIPIRKKLDEFSINAKNV